MGNIAFGVGIAVVVGGLGAAIVIPNLMGPRCTGGNSTAAIATLRNLASAQAQFQSAGHADIDGDGIGEFGTFGEMTGAGGIRVDPAAATRGRSVNPSILSAALASVDDNGVVTKSGHAFRIFLPGPRGKAVHEKSPGSSLGGPVDTDAAETVWCAYAWPVAAGNSGQKAFFVDQGGAVWWTENKDGRYSGVFAGPAWDAAMHSNGRSAWTTAPDANEGWGRDGNLWKRAN